MLRVRGGCAVCLNWGINSFKISFSDCGSTLAAGHIFYTVFKYCDVFSLDFILLSGLSFCWRYRSFCSPFFCWSQTNFGNFCFIKNCLPYFWLKIVDHWRLLPGWCIWWPGNESRLNNRPSLIRIAFTPVKAQNSRFSMSTSPSGFILDFQKSLMSQPREITNGQQWSHYVLMTWLISGEGWWWRRIFLVGSHDISSCIEGNQNRCFKEDQDP